MISTRIPLVALRQQYEEVKPQIDAAIASVIGRSAFIGGSEIDVFERWFAAFCGAPYALGVSSGSTAIELVLRAMDVGAGDEVIVPAHTFIASAAAVSATGARPRFVDVDEGTATLDPAALDAVIGPRTRAILAVHLYGRPARMSEILDVGGRHGIPVIEDAAQAHGASYYGRRVGSLSLAAAFSFYPTKNLPAFGDAGLLTTTDERLAGRVALLRDHGRVSRYEHAALGYTARMDTLQAAILRVHADKLEEWNRRRQLAARWYRETLPVQLLMDDDDPQAKSVYHVFVIRVPRRDALREFLDARGVSTAVHYPLPVHLQPAYRALGHRLGDFPAAERLAAEVVSLPMHPFLQRGDVEHVAAAVSEFLDQS